jgi:DNA recombination protein RmuC
MDLFFIGEILLSILLGFGLGYILFLNKLLMERKSSEEQNIKFQVLQSNLDHSLVEIKKLENLKSTSEIEITSIRNKLVASETENKNYQSKIAEQKQELVDLGEKLKDQFKNLANEILEEKSKRFTEQNQVNLNNLLGPLGEKIKDFEKKVQETFEKDIAESNQVRQQIQNLTELNKKMTEETTNLTSALKGSSKVQGDWGEIQLSKIFELSGLVQGLNYTLQENIKTEDNLNVRPDAIVKFPDGKSIVVDSKVSLTAYTDFCNEDTPSLKKAHLENHLISVKKHIESLSGKAYQKNLDSSVDFVFMFMPIEAAFTLAMQSDPSLFHTASRSNIFIVTPTTLLSSLRTVNYTWKQESQKQNIAEIVSLGSDILDKLTAFTEDMTDIEKHLNLALKSYSDASTKFTGKGGITSKVNKMKKLGVVQNKIPKSTSNLLLTDTDEEE